MHNDDPIESHQINILIKKANKNKNGLIMCSDTNARHSLWGNEINNKRGEELARIFIGEHELSIENSDLGYTRSNIRSTSTIDLTLTNQWAPEIKNWNIARGVSSSDHEIIQMFFENGSTQTKKMETRDHKNCNNNLFRQKLSEKKDTNTDYKHKMARANISSNTILDHTDDINYCNDKLSFMIKNII